jgi:hypothetical protein
MSWSAWLPIQAAGYSGATPFARYVSGVPFTRYATSWERPQWRYDRATGEVEYKGLISVTADYGAASTSYALIECWMDPSPGMPKPTQYEMFFGMSNNGDASWGQVLRMDVAPSGTSGIHHTINTSTGTTGLLAGRWVYLNVHKKFGNEPSFTPWTNMGTSYSGVTMSLDSRWGYPYDANWPCQWRCTTNYSRWQWRGLLRNNGGALGTTPPYVPIVNIYHPNPHDGRMYILNHGGGHYPWGGGQVANMRLDALPITGGHRLVLTSSKAQSPVYLMLQQDYELRPFG